VWLCPAKHNSPHAWARTRAAAGKQAAAANKHSAYDGYTPYSTVFAFFDQGDESECPESKQRKKRRARNFTTTTTLHVCRDVGKYACVCKYLSVGDLAGAASPCLLLTHCNELHLY